jgi:hypothetical protein
MFIALKPVLKKEITFYVRRAKHKYLNKLQRTVPTKVDITGNLQLPLHCSFCAFLALVHEMFKLNEDTVRYVSMLSSISFRQILTNPGSRLLRSRMKAFVQIEFWCVITIALRKSQHQRYQISKKKRKKLIGRQSIRDIKTAITFFKYFSLW